MKAAVTECLNRFVRENRLGFYVGDGMRFTNAEAELATNPDGMFVSTATFEAKQVGLRSGAKGQVTELRGTPDVVIEVVSESSVDKDTAWLISAYHDAGVPEYWVIDARTPKPKLDIYLRGRRRSRPCGSPAGGSGPRRSA